MSLPGKLPQSIKPNWKRANEGQKLQYVQTLEHKLDRMSTPDCIQQCRDVHCQDENHCNKIDEYANDILQCVEEAAYQELPVPNSNVKE